MILTFFYRLYQFCFVLPFMLLATAITAIVTIVGCMVGDSRFWGYWPGRIWSRMMCTFCLLPVKVEGRENIDKNTSYVFVSNHQGAFDIFLIYGYIGRSFKWMMKKSLRNIPLVGKACESARFIFVDKSGPKAIQRTYDDAREILREGVSLVVFPEGARTFTGEMGRFQKGAYQLAKEIGLDIVPVTINGSFNALSRQRGFNFVNWSRLTLTIHRPIASDSVEEAMEASRQAIEAALAR